MTASVEQSVPDHELVRMIGRGSYGEVWLARNIMGTWRAVKIVRRAAFDNASPFEREFAGIRRIEPVSRTHEGIVDILHVGRREEDGFFYYVMELADSATQPPDADADAYCPLTLAAKLGAHKQLPAEDCLALVTALAGVLAQLHESGLVHRDVKPSNVLYVGGVPKLGDIGLVAESDNSRTFVGTEGYVPAEGPGTPQADIFGLGKTVYEALTGFDRRRFPEVPADWPERYDFEQCVEINELVLRACDTHPDRRYKSARELLADAALLASGRSVKRLRRIEQRLQFTRRASMVLGGIALAASGAFFWQQRETELTKVKLEAAAATEAARMAKWYGLQERVRAARYDIQPGSVADGLAAAKEAAKEKPTLQLRDDAAYLLSRPDLVPLTAIPVDRHFVKANLDQRQYLRLGYRLHTAPAARKGKRAELVPIDGGAPLAMPEEFVEKHDWSLEFVEGGTAIKDGAGNRWAVPGTKPVRMAARTPFASEEKFRNLLPNYRHTFYSHDGRWSAPTFKNADGSTAVHTYFEGVAGPIYRRGGATTAVFLEPSHMMASNSWLGVMWVDDLLHERPIFRIPTGGFLEYSHDQRLLAPIHWDSDAAQIYEWRPSAVLHNFANSAAAAMNVKFSPDGKWLATWNDTAIHWWSLSPLITTQPALKTASLPSSAIQWFEGGKRFSVISKASVRSHRFDGIGAAPTLADAVIEPWKLADLPGYGSPPEALTASKDGRIVAAGGRGPVGIWRDGALWKSMESVTPGYVLEPARLSLSPDGRLLAVGGFHARGAWVWELEGGDGKPVVRHQEKFADGCNVAFSPDGKWISFAGNEETRIVTTTGWRTVARWPKKMMAAYETGFSDDGRVLYLQPSSEEVSLVRVGTWETLVTLRLPIHEAVIGLQISADAHWLACRGSGKSDTWLWDLKKLSDELTSLGLGWE